MCVATTDQWVANWLKEKLSITHGFYNIVFNEILYSVWKRLSNLSSFKHESNVVAKSSLKKESGIWQSKVSLCFDGQMTIPLSIALASIQVQYYIDWNI